MSSSPHVIRLRGPWQAELRPASSPDEINAPDQPHPDAQPKSITVDALTGLSRIPNLKIGERLRASRRFRRPTGLGPQTSVRLIIEPAGLPAQVSLNGALLGVLDDRQVKFQIAGLLQPANELCLDLQLPGHHKQSTTRPAIDVRLEIVD